MARRDPKGDARTNASRPTMDTANTITNASSAHSSTVDREGVECSIPEYHEAFLEVFARSDGWLRIVPQNEGKQVYWKYKFSRGPHAGGYVMWLDVENSWQRSVMGIAWKLRQVDSGALRPTPDTPYG